MSKRISSTGRKFKYPSALLPLMNDGGTIPNWDKVKTTLNPKNWGVTDYTDKGSFDNAYAAARKAGGKEFMWNNERFNTNYDGTPQQQLKETGITDEQLQKRNNIKERLSNNLNPRGYNNYVNRIINTTIKNEKEVERDEESPKRLDAFNLYMGKPQTSNTFKISDYKPSISKDTATNYYSLNDINTYNFLDYLDDNGNIKDYSELTPSQRYDFEVMGSYTVNKGEDEHGKYVSYYDKWDLNPSSLKNPITSKEITTDFGKPFEIYDRIYYRENPNLNKFEEYSKKISDLWDLAIETQDTKYRDEALKLYPIRNSYFHQDKYVKQYYTDKELSELDVNHKNFDTQALQRELFNRGVKLPKSTTYEGKFDGIWGDETKQALLDYQKNIKQPTNTLEDKVPMAGQSIPVNFKYGGVIKDPATGLPKFNDGGTIPTKTDPATNLPKFNDEEDLDPSIKTTVKSSQEEIRNYLHSLSIGQTGHSIGSELYKKVIDPATGIVTNVPYYMRPGSKVVEINPIGQSIPVNFKYGGVIKDPATGLPKLKYKKKV